VARKKILFVDNRPEYMHQPVLRLRMEGYEVVQAESGDQGLEALKENGYDLLVIDAELPGSDGWQVVKKVREDPEISKTKVLVFMAGKGETGKLMLVSVDAELRRPFRMEELVETVKTVLG
jgi:DNA-binding response OmpR family regulator